MKGHKISFESSKIIKIPSSIAKKLYRKNGRVVFSIGEYGCQMENDRDLEFSALYDQIDQIPPEYKNLSNEEITEKCNNAIASLYKNRKENCEIAFGVK